jgi:peroxiredoxin
MKKTSFSRWPFRAVVSGLFILCCFVPAFGAKPISSGMDLPQFMLSAPDAEDARKYLGLKNAKPFALSQVPAKLIILDIFYVLCLECQKQAPDINKIYELMQQDPELEKNIRIIGIGIRSSREKLRAFKTSFRVKFPLIPDEDNTVYSKVGEPPIPFLILVNDKGRVLLSHQGPFKNVEEFFGQIKKLYKVR